MEFQLIHTSTRVRTLLAVLGAILMFSGAAPTQAQSLGSDFSLGGSQAESGARTLGSGSDDRLSIQICLTNRQIRRALRNYGFSDIEFVRNLPRERVIVEALYNEDDWYYSMRVHRCRSYVDRVRPLYPSWDSDY